MLKLRQWCLLFSFVLFLVFVSLLFDCFSAKWDVFSFIGMLRLFGTFIVLLVSFAFYDIFTMGAADSFGFGNLCLCYVVLRFKWILGYRLQQRFEQKYGNFSMEHEKNLLNIIQQNSGTLYVKDKNLANVKSVAEFRKMHPITTYSDYTEYIERIKAGEKNILFPGPIAYYATTSGTTGKHKVYPKSASYKDENLMKYFSTLLGYILFNEMIPKYLRLKRIVNVFTYRAPSPFSGGIPKGPVSTYILRYSPLITMPRDAYYIEETNISLYINLVFSMREREVSILTTLFAQSALSFFVLMESRWRSICDDIEHGELNGVPDLSDDLRSSLNKMLPPDPLRAQEVRHECSKGFQAIGRRLWPDLSASSYISSGPFKSAASILELKYLAKIPNFSKGHGGTEGIYSTNRKFFGIDPTYTLNIDINFYELLSADETETILPEEAKIGECYELVITTPEGLYRYKTTDIIKVVGFYKSTMEYKFMHRVGDYLNLRNEKTAVSTVEAILTNVMTEQLVTCKIKDYICTESVNIDATTGETSETRYWIFIELDDKVALPKTFADRVEDVMYGTLQSYAAHRDSLTASSVKIAQVQAGTFTRLCDHMLKTKPALHIDQYKTPRRTQDSQIIQLLLESIIE